MILDLVRICLQCFDCYFSPGLACQKPDSLIMDIFTDWQICSRLPMMVPWNQIFPIFGSCQQKGVTSMRIAKQQRHRRELFCRRSKNSLYHGRELGDLPASPEYRKFSGLQVYISSCRGGGAFLVHSANQLYLRTQSNMTQAK